MFNLALEAVSQRCSIKRVFLKISQNSQENNCARVSFPVNFVKFLRTLFLTEHLRWLLLWPAIAGIYLHSWKIIPFNLRAIQLGEMRTRITPNTDTFHAVTLYDLYDQSTVEIQKQPLTRFPENSCSETIFKIHRKHQCQSIVFIKFQVYSLQYY